MRVCIKTWIGCCLCSGALMCPAAVGVSAKSTDVLNVDFENISYEEFSNSDAVTIRPGIASDVLSVEEESTGNRAFRIYREAAEVDDNTTPLGFNYKLPLTFTSRKVNVSFKIKAEKTYRSRWRDLGSAMTSQGGRNLFLFTHSMWAWAGSTGAGFWNSNISTPDVWYEVKYELDIDNKSVAVGAGISGSTIAVKNKTCTGGDFASLEFTIGKQHASWTANNSGDLVYWIDDIKVSADSMNILSASVADNAENVGINNPIEIVFDEKIKDESVSKDKFILSCGGEDIDVSLQKISDTVVTVFPQNGFDYNKRYTLIVKKNVMSQNGTIMTKDYVLSFKTASLIDCDIENGKRYNEGFLPDLKRVKDVAYTAELSVNGAEFSAYDFSGGFTESGSYRLRIKAEDENGKTQTEEYNFEIISAVAPIIVGEVKIEGAPVVGGKLSAVYLFKDENGDEQDMKKTVYKWYRVDKSGKEEMLDEGRREYVLRPEDEDCYIKLSVTPFSKAEPCEGETYWSDLFVGPMNPVVSEINKTGEVKEGAELGVVYNYFDENGDEEIRTGDTKTVITWYSSADKNGEFVKIGEGESYTLEEKDNDHWLKIGIVPKNAGSGSQTREFYSDIFAGPFAPCAEDVKITGTVKVGNVVGVSYRFFDNNNDEEKDSIVEWYVGDVLVSKNDSYKISGSDAGKKLYAAVTPMSEQAPFAGKTVKSDIFTIPSKKSESYSSSGSSSKGNSAAPPPVKPEEKDEQNTKQETDIAFADITGHWAEKEIKTMAQKGVINGKTENIFAPDQGVTRAELAAIISRTYGLKGTVNQFADVDEGAWFKEAVSAVYESGYMMGDGRGNFRPNDCITRQEMAVVLKKILKGTENKNEDKVFADSDKIADWAYDAVEFAYKSGLMQGVDEENFNPQGFVTRAQAAVILLRMTENRGV